MARGKYSLGIDIGGTNTVFGLVDKKGNVKGYISNKELETSLIKS